MMSDYFDGMFLFSIFGTVTFFITQPFTPVQSVHCTERPLHSKIKGSETETFCILKGGDASFASPPLVFLKNSK